MEKYGAAYDNLLSAQVDTVDGRQIEASPKLVAKDGVEPPTPAFSGLHSTKTQFRFEAHSLHRVSRIEMNLRWRCKG